MFFFSFILPTRILEEFQDSAVTLKMELKTQETKNRGRGGGERTAFSSSGARYVHSSKDVMTHYNTDARLMADFEKSNESGKSFNYTKSVVSAPKSVTEDEMTAYLGRIQRGGFIQPFGCMLAIEEPTFKIIGYSGNCSDLLGLQSLVESEKLEGLLGTDARTLFTLSSRASLAKAVASREISMLNPLWVHSRSNKKAFYAILHRIDVGIVIDLEPAHSGDPALLLAGAVQSQKLAVRAISRLQSLSGGDIGVLCDTVVEEVQKLTGYDRVMIYKFHDDYHGEILSEIRRSDLEPYLGLHYPAIDIPQAARFLFKQNRVRVICDCKAEQVNVIQSKELKQPLCLVNSTLRSPHGCHLQYMSNMGTIASLVLAVLINENDSMKLWGLVVCHHTSPRYVPFPLRYACEFLMQAFSLQLYMELQLASQLAEKKIIQMQTLLCDMLLRDAPFGIVTQSPSIIDLVKCDGAAMYYGGKCWLLGVTPTEAEVKDLATWLLKNHGDSTGLSTDSLADAGYPGADLLGDAVCGMATAKITSSDFLFWFRSHTAKEIRWGGAKHHPEDRDDGEKLHPRSSFNAFLEVVKNKSLPWDVSEINAIHSLQIIMRDSLRDNEEIVPKVVVQPQQGDSNTPSLYELTSVANEMVRLIETAAAPIFGVDSSGMVNGWNTKMAEITGLPVSEALGKSIMTEIIHQESCLVFQNLLRRALQGEEDKNIEVKLLKYGMHSENSAVYLVVNACTSRDYTGTVVGVCFVGQDVTSEKVVHDKFIRMQGDYKAIVQSINPFIPPIFAADENAYCSEWNAAMENLTGWMKHDVIGKILPGEIFGGLCELNGQDMLTKFMILLYRAISGHDTDRLLFSFLDRRGQTVEVFLTANKRVDAYGAIIGCFCFLQTDTVDLELSPRCDQEDESILKLKELAYIRQEMKNPLNGIRFTHKILETMDISDDQKHLLETSDACERQIMSIIEDMNFAGIIEGSRVELSMEEFLLGNIIDAVVSQFMISLNEKSLQLIHNIPVETKKLLLCGDQMKLQLVLSDFLLSIVHHAPSNGWVEIKVSPGLKLIQDGSECMHIKFSLAHPGEGLPSALIEEMSGERNHCTTEKGIALNLSKMLVEMMNGHVSYIREQDRCHFLIELEFRTSQSRKQGSSLELGRLLF